MPTIAIVGPYRFFFYSNEENDPPHVHVERDRAEAKLPLAWFPRLLHGTVAQRNEFRWIGDGLGIHWPQLDEDLSVAGFLQGTLAPSHPTPFKK